MAGYRVTVRIGSRIERAQETTIEAALDVLERRLRETAESVSPEPRSVFGRSYEPSQQVAARGEISMPGRLRRPRAGVDIRGDGSAEAWTGRLRRRVVVRNLDEDAFAALRRVLA